MNLALLSTYDAALVPAALVSGIRSLGWSDSPPEGLTDLDLTRITEAIGAGRAASTRRSYAWQWGRFERWCAGRGITSMPATPATVCAYLADFAAQGVASRTIECACAAIAAENETEGRPNPVADHSVKAVRRGLRRTLGTAPRRQSRPLSTAEIRRMIATINRTTARGSRDAVLILLGFASALRRSELVGLTLADIEPQPEGMLIRVRKSKTDPEARGQLVGVAHGNHPATDSATASPPAPSPAAALPACSRYVQPQPASRPNTSADTHSAPATPPPQPWPASDSTASPPKPGTPGSPPSSSTTSDPSKPCRSLPAATSGCEDGVGGCP